MGSIYMEHVVGRKNPKVAIVNIGAEEEKGNALVKRLYRFLENAMILILSEASRREIFQKVMRML